MIFSRLPFLLSRRGAAEHREGEQQQQDIHTVGTGHKRRLHATRRRHYHIANGHRDARETGHGADAPTDLPKGQRVRNATVVGSNQSGDLPVSRSATSSPTAALHIMPTPPSPET